MRHPDVDSQGVAQKRKYAKKQTEYAAMYGKGIATIKRWWKAGYPLDDPDAMGEYLSPAGRKSEVDPFPGPNRIEPPPVEEEEESPVCLGEDFFAGEGILASIERLKKAERERAAAYFKAVTFGHEARLIQNRFQEWTGIIEALRKLAKDEPSIRKANGLAMDLRDVEATWSETVAAFRAALANFAGSAADRLVGMTEFHDIKTILEEEVDALLKTFDTKSEEDGQSEIVDAGDSGPGNEADSPDQGLGVDR